MSRELLDYYTKTYAESERLEQGLGRLEFERTKAIVARYLGTPSQVILDVGGGAGPYAFWLAGLDHQVHLLDRVPRHIKTARQRQVTNGLASALIGDARCLPYRHFSADLVLLLGPLYHLSARIDRVNALVECRRVLKPGGYVFAAGISRFASLLDGFRSDLFADPAYAQIVDEDLRSGQHEPGAEGRYFTRAFLHRPDELGDEVKAAGLQLEAVLGVEGPMGLLPALDAWETADDERFELVMRYASMLEAEPSLLGASFHLLAIGRKP